MLYPFDLPILIKILLVVKFILVNEKDIIVIISCVFLSDGHGAGWQAVPTHDPSVQDAANHAVKTIQQRSNSDRKSVV